MKNVLIACAWMLAIASPSPAMAQQTVDASRFAQAAARMMPLGQVLEGAAKDDPTWPITEKPGVMDARQLACVRDNLTDRQFQALAAGRGRIQRSQADPRARGGTGVPCRHGAVVGMWRMARSRPRTTRGISAPTTMSRSRASRTARTASEDAALTASSNSASVSYSASSSPRTTAMRERRDSSY